jgi:hypothetical protein
MKLSAYFSKLAAGVATLCLGACLPAMAQEQPRDAHDHLLWQISGPALDQPSYLYGTIHIIGVNDFKISAAVKEAFAQSQTLALEVDISNMMEVSMALMQDGMMSDGQTLPDLISPEAYQQLQAFMTDSLEMNAMMIKLSDKILPMLTASNFYPMMLDSEMRSYEMTFTEMAQADSMPIVGLETMRDQLQKVASIPYEEQAQALVKMVVDFRAEKARIDTLIAAYVAEDLDGLYQQVVDSEEIGAYQEVMLDERNRNWIPVIGELIKAQPTFVAVGAGHLWGKQGVIALLQAAGYTVTPIK